MKPPAELPTAEWTTDTPWCESLGITQEWFRKMLRKHNVPHVVFGSNVLIHGPTFFARMAEMMNQRERPANDPKANLKGERGKPKGKACV